MQPAPELKEFRIEMLDDGIAHLIFDMPDRTMNVFSNAAIHEAEAFADWLPRSGLKGVLVSSGKTTAFCAGADLGELAEAYAMIIAAPADQRTQIARDHFAPIGRAFRKLEKANVPIAFAINGLALGGGCEFAMAGHYRVLADTPATALGLPESLVGLFPGGGGTQRMPRLVGLEASLPILLDGARLSPQEAVSAGAAHRAVPAGQEIEAALEWLRSSPAPLQPWDRDGWVIPSASEIERKLAPVRASRFAVTKGHYPAITAILDCLEQGLPLPMDDAVATEINLFAELIKRPEPRDMIRTLFLGKQAFAKRRKSEAVPVEINRLKTDVAAALAYAADTIGREAAEHARSVAGFDKPLPLGGNGESPVKFNLNMPDVPALSATNLWIENPTENWQKVAARLLSCTVLAVLPYRDSLSDEEQKLADFIVVSDLGFPAYLGGPFALLESVGTMGIRRMLELPHQ
jgi:enoyl-CoA hydratase/carnithine racemase